MSAVCAKIDEELDVDSAAVINLFNELTGEPVSVQGGIAHIAMITHRMHGQKQGRLQALTEILETLERDKRSSDLVTGQVTLYSNVLIRFIGFLIKQDREDIAQYEKVILEQAAEEPKPVKKARKRRK